MDCRISYRLRLLAVFWAVIYAAGAPGNAQEWDRAKVKQGEAPVTVVPVVEDLFAELAINLLNERRWAVRTQPNSLFEGEVYHEFQYIKQDFRNASASDHDNYFMVRSRVTHYDGFPVTWILKRAYELYSPFANKKVKDKAQDGVRRKAEKIASSLKIKNKIIRNLIGKILGDQAGEVFDEFGKAVDERVDQYLRSRRCGVDVKITPPRSKQLDSGQVVYWQRDIPISLDLDLENAVPTTSSWDDQSILAGSMLSVSAYDSACPGATLDTEFEYIHHCDLMLRALAGKEVKCTGIHLNETLKSRTIRFPPLPLLTTDESSENDFRLRPGGFCRIGARAAPVRYILERTTLDRANTVGPDGGYYRGRFKEIFSLYGTVTWTYVSSSKFLIETSFPMDKSLIPVNRYGDPGPLYKSSSYESSLSCNIVD